MKFTTFIITVLSCLCICLAKDDHLAVKIWGRVNGRELATENIIVDSYIMKKQIKTITFPRVSYIKIEDWIIKLENLLKFDSKKYLFSIKAHIFIFLNSIQDGPGYYPITGIKHIDHKEHNVEVSFVKGDIGHRSIELRIKSQRGHGINSTFIFYTDYY